MVTSKCLAILYLPMTLPTAVPTRGPGQPAGRDAGGDRGEELLGGGQQGFALAGAFVGQRGVAAGDQPLAGKVRRGDLGEVLLVEEAELQRAVVGHELADGGRAQRGDPPVVLVEFAERVDAGAGDHAAVADHDHLPQPEPVPRTTSAISVNAAGSAVFPSRTRTATGRPSGSVSSPYSIWTLPFLPSRE